MANSSSQLEKQNAELQRQIRELKEERAKDAAFLKSFCKDLIDLRLVIQDLNDPTGSTMANKLIVSNEHVVSLLSQVNEYKQEISELKEKIAETNGIAEQNAVLKKNIRYLEAELDNVKKNDSHATNQQLEAQLEALKKENAGLKNAKKMAESELAKANKRTNVLAASNIHLCGKVESYRQQIEELEEKLAVQFRRFNYILDDLDPINWYRNDLVYSLITRTSEKVDNAQYEEALEVYFIARMVEESAKNDPKTICDICILISGCYRLMKKYENALQFAEEAIKHNPMEAMGYFARGEAHRELGNRDKAIADFQKAVELEPDYLDAANELATLLNQ